MDIDTTPGVVTPNTRRNNIRGDILIGITLLGVLAAIPTFGYFGIVDLPDPNKPKECAAYSMSDMRKGINEVRARIPLLKTKSLDQTWEVRDGQCYVTDLGDNGAKISWKVTRETFNGRSYWHIQPDLSGLLNGLFDQ